MGARVLDGNSEFIIFRKPGFKLVMARQEMRQNNGDLEVPPRLFRRSGTKWEELDWNNLPDDDNVRWLVRMMHLRRNDHCPRFRNPIGSLRIDPVEDAGLSG